MNNFICVFNKDVKIVVLRTQDQFDAFLFILF